MVDRVSALGNVQVVELIRDRFVPLAIDATNHYFWSDPEDKQYLSASLNTFVVRTAEGKILDSMGTTFAEDYDTALLRMLKFSLRDFKPSQTKLELKPRKSLVPRDVTVVRVAAKILGPYEPYSQAKLFRFHPEAKKLSTSEQNSQIRAYDRYSRMFHASSATDHLWVRQEEITALAHDEIPPALQARIARYHLEDATRGQALYWHEPGNVKHLEMKLQNGRLSGKVYLEDKERERGYEADLLGFVEVKDGKLARFDLLAKGEFWGGTGYTFRELAPSGKFPFAVGFTLATGDLPADQVPPNALLRISGPEAYFKPR